MKFTVHKRRLVVLAALTVSTAAALYSSRGAWMRYTQPDPAVDAASAAAPSVPDPAPPRPNPPAVAAGAVAAVPSPSATVPAPPAPAAAVAVSTNDILAQLRAKVLASEYGQMPIQDLLVVFRETPGGRDIQEIMTALIVRKAEALPYLREILRSGTLWEKKIATELLSASPWPETYEELLQLAQAQGEHYLARQGALFALGALGKPEAGAAIVAILQEPDLPPTVQLPAISALGRIGYLDAVDPLRAFTTNDVVQVRIFAWRSLQELGQPADREYLLSLLDGPDYAVREDACGALALVDGDDVERRLRQVAEKDEHQAVRQGAHQALIRRALPGLSDSEKWALLRAEMDRAEFHTQTWIIRTMLEECGSEGRAGVAALAREDNRLGERAATYLLRNAAY